MERWMSVTLEYMQRRARELARSGKYPHWRSVAFELQFDPILERVFSSDPSGKQAFQWLRGRSTRAEIDELCREARNLRLASVQSS
jgi:hypothetical protein